MPCHSIPGPRGISISSQPMKTSLGVFILCTIRASHTPRCISPVLFRPISSASLMFADIYTVDAVLGFLLLQRDGWAMAECPGASNHLSVGAGGDRLALECPRPLLPCSLPFLQVRGVLCTCPRSLHFSSSLLGVVQSVRLDIVPEYTREDY